MARPFPTAEHPGRLQWKGKGTPEALPASSASILEKLGRSSDDPALLIQGDNLAAMSHLLSQGMERQIQLVYIDPPFCSGADYVRTLRLRGSEGGLLGEEIGKQVQYTDHWTEDQYLQFCYERLLLIHQLLADSGSIVLHVDEHMSHMLRCVLDEVFGRENFVNEIVWHYPDNFQGNVRGLANNHNLLFWYSKSRKFAANPVRIPLAKPTKRDRRVWSKELGKVVAARDESGKLIYDIYTDKKADDVWTIGQSSVSKTRSHEYVGYPTQKPEQLLQRIIEATTQTGDLVFDAFAGSGTTACVAQKMGRRWISCDNNPVSIQTLCKRLDRILAHQVNPKESAPKGGISVSEPAQTSVHVLALQDARTSTREGSLVVESERTQDQLILRLHGLESKSLKKELGRRIKDWRRVADSIRIDWDYDGQVFQSRLWDRPTRSELVQGEYRVPLSEVGEQVAVRLVDVLGGEIRWQGALASEVER